MHKNKKAACVARFGFLRDGIVSPDGATDPVWGCHQTKKPLSWLFLFIAYTSCKKA